MTMVYVVTSGEYSDYHIEKVFSTRALAETWVGKFKKDFDIRPFELDDMADKPQAGYLIEMDLLTGNVISTYCYQHTGGDIHSKCEITKRSWPSSGRLTLYMKHDVDDEKRAIKITAEKRAQLVALNRIQEGVYDRETLEPIKLYE